VVCGTEVREREKQEGGEECEPAEDGGGDG
jgi:hypothetical protein